MEPQPARGRATESPLWEADFAPSPCRKQLAMCTADPRRVLRWSRKWQHAALWLKLPQGERSAVRVMGGEATIVVFSTRLTVLGAHASAFIPRSSAAQLSVMLRFQHEEADRTSAMKLLSKKRPHQCQSRSDRLPSVLAALRLSPAGQAQPQAGTTLLLK